MEIVSRESLRLGVFAGLAAVVLGVASAVAPGPILLLGIAITASLVLFLMRPEALLHGTLIAAFLAAPTVFPTTWVLTVGSRAISLYLFEPLLLASLVYVLFNQQLDRVVLRRVLVALGLFGAWAVLGALLGHSYAEIYYDIRMPVNLVLAATVAAAVAKTPIVGRAWNVVLVVLWVSAVFTLLSSVLGLALRGDELGAAGVGTDPSEVSRILSPASYPAIAALCAAVGLVVAGRSKLYPLVPWLLPSLLIVLLSFSRNNLIAVFVALLFGLVAGGLHRTIWRAAGYTLAVALGLLSIWLAAKTAQATAIGAWVVEQFDYMIKKVFEGILPGSIDTDPSAQYRLTQENPFLFDGIRDSPLFGHGFGFAYRPLSSTGYMIIEYGEALRYYAHNFYLWLAVKTGIVGFTLFVWAIVLPVLRCWRDGSRATLGAAVAAASLLAASIVAPMPLGPSTAVLLGALIGFCWAGLSLRLGGQETADQGSPS